MDIDKLTTEALEKAYQARIIEIYNRYFGVLLSAQGNAQDITEAGKQLTTGVEFARQALSDAENLIG